MEKDCTSKHKFQHGSSEAQVTCDREVPHQRHGATVIYDDASAVTWSWPLSDKERKELEK